MTVRAIEIETTGTDPETDRIIEIASVDVLAGGTITNQQSTLVRPGIPIPPESSAVHHLLDEDLAGAPPLMDLVGMFRGADAYVAHNATLSELIVALVEGVLTLGGGERFDPNLVPYDEEQDAA
jgi:DNA polymerase III epsilon subunit-like protein